ALLNPCPNRHRLSPQVPTMTTAPTAPSTTTPSNNPPTPPPPLLNVEWKQSPPSDDDDNDNDTDTWDTPWASWTPAVSTPPPPSSSTEAAQPYFDFTDVPFTERTLL